MAYDFFFSYPRAASDSYLDRFFADLSAEVARHHGLPKDAAVGYRDQREIERGAAWPQDLLDGLNESRTIVAVYAPAYFKSEYCMRELELFIQRAADAGPRTRIKPVLWFPGPVPASIGHLQYTFGNPASEANTKGLRYVAKRRLGEYDDIVEELANDVFLTAQEGPLPRVNAGFAANVAPAAVAEPQPDLGGPGHVRFVYVVPSADEMPHRAGCYGSLPRYWRPYADCARIGPLSQEVAGSQEFTSDELAFDANVIAAMRDAERKRNLVVMIVDGWSVRVGTAADVLRLVDEQNFLNCSILAPWNEQDEATRTALQSELRDALYRWTRSNDAIRFNDGITTFPALKATLADTLTHLRAQLFSRAPARPAPHVPKPTLMNNVARVA